MIIEGNNKDSHKPSSEAGDAASENFKPKHYHVAEAAVGDKNNDDVACCKICASNGWPHESIKFSKIYGRVLSDGRREILGYRPINYVTYTPHQHKEAKQQQAEGRYYTGFDLIWRQC